MSFDHAMTTLARLTASAEALAALGAHLRADTEGLKLDPAMMGCGCNQSLWW